MPFALPNDIVKTAADPEEIGFRKNEFFSALQTG